jgi:methionyl-tRNA synthetase
MPEKTTIVTAIPYVNSTPHIGTLLTTLSGDVTARYHRMRGEDVFFVAGADENGLKIKEAAEAQGRDPHEFVTDISGRFQSIFETFHIEYDEFVRTTEERHFRTSQEFFKRLQERGFIYSGLYEGWYDVVSETFYKDSELVNGLSPDGNPVRWVSEENFFFKLTAFEQPLLEHIEAHPQFIVPESRRNEVLSFIRQGLRDAAISRRNPGWGIPVPGQPDQVIYVWFDALINYVTATGWPDPVSETIWPPIVQWVGKDILTRFHATLWPAMLMGVGLPLPKTVAAHAWIVLGGGEKLSKTKGNQVLPGDLATGIANRTGCDPEVAVDVVRHYLIATMPFENDSTFTPEEFDRRYNNDLANDLGNALNRTLSTAHRFCGGIVPEFEPESVALEAIETAKLKYQAAMSGFRLEQASEAAMGLVRFLNKYIDTRAPWALAKAEDPELPAVMGSMLLCVRASEGMMRPILPYAADQIALQLGLLPLTVWSEIGTAASLPARHVLGQPKPIFPRLEIEKQKPKMTEKPKPVETPVSEITIEDFAKIQLRVARVVEAEPLEGSDKLLKLQVMVGDQPRQIIAGIRKNYSPEDLIGRQVVVVANLKPAKLRGADSQGMLLAAVSEDGGAILLQPDEEAPEGAKVR